MATVPLPHTLAVNRPIYTVSQKTGVLQYVPISPTNLDKYIYFLVQRIVNESSTDSDYFAICCETENQLGFSSCNQSRGWHAIIV